MFNICPPVTKWFLLGRFEVFYATGDRSCYDAKISALCALVVDDC